MAAYTVPTIFTAVDKMTAVVKRMEASVGGFASKASIGVNAVNKGLNSLLPSIGGMAKQFVNLAASAALFGGVAFSFKELADYEKAIQSFRRQLSDLNDNAFMPYQQQINAVANATRRSAVDVAAAFEAIALRNHDLTSNADGMAKIAASGILLSKAAGMEITPATEGLVNVLTLFKLGAGGADRAVNVLAAGMKYGSATVDEMVDSFKTFGPVAVGANLTLEQSAALLGTLAKLQIKGEYAGTTLRTGIIRLQKAGLGYRNGLFDINDALEQALTIYARMNTAKKKDAFLNQLFGMRGIIAGRVLLTNIPLFRQITKEITGTAEAHRMAAINTDNLINRAIELKNQWINYITSNSKAAAGFQRLKEIIVSVTNNLDTIVKWAVRLVEAFLALKAIIWTTQLILAGYNIVMGITGAVTGMANIAIGESAVALGAYKIATGLATASNYLFGTSIGQATLATVAESEALTGMASEFALADTAATGFFATLSEFVIPAALATMAGWSLWEAFKEYQAGQHHYGIPGQNKTPFFNSGVGNMKEEKAYEKWSGSQPYIPGVDYSDNSMAERFAKLYTAKPNAKSYPSLTASDATMKPESSSKSDSLHVYFNDPHGHIDTTKTIIPSHIPITLKQSSTTDNR